MDKKFNPGINKSYYLTRNLLFNAIKGKANVLHGNVLDFGCGSKPYKHLINYKSYTGLDFEGQGHSHEGEQIDIIYDGKTLPDNLTNFDSLISTEAFEHVFNLPSLLKQLSGTLKPGGKALITMPFIIQEHEAPNDCSRYTSYGIRKLLEASGFGIVSYQKLGTSIEAQMQMFMTYLDSWVICKFNKIGLYSIVSSIVFTCLNIFTMVLNEILPKRQEAFLNHIIVCIKTED